MATGNRVFTEAQRDLLAGVLNRIIPPEGTLPGAGDLGLADFIEGVVATQPQLRRLFINGLAQIGITAGRQGTTEFQALADESKDAALKEVEASNPEFFEALVRQTYNGYYTDASIFQQLGYPETKPVGSPPELLDESLLEQQRQRAPFWRRV